MRTKERKSFLWLMVLLCSAALLGVCFTPGLSNADKASNSVQDLFEMSPEDQPEDVGEDIYRDDVGLDPDAELEEAFGGRIQVTFISNSAFKPLTSSTSYSWQPNGTLSWGGVGNITFMAPINLPSGALFLGAALVYWDTNAGANPDMLIFRSEGGDSSPDLLCNLNPPNVSSGWVVSDAGCNAINTRVRHFFDTGVIGIGYDVMVQLPQPGTSLGLKGVAIAWARQIRTGLSHPFTDIGSLPAVFQNSIAALYQSGITTGTTATTYSPSQAVNRGQMAVFLARALGLHWDAVDGF